MSWRTFINCPNCFGKGWHYKGSSTVSKETCLACAGFGGWWRYE